MKRLSALRAALVAGALLVGLNARAWDYEVHRFINQLALASLPEDFPAFVRDAAARERIAFLSGEPDRWRNTPDLALRHCNGPDHFLDLEDLAKFGLAPEQLSPFRYEFVAQLTRGRLAHPQNFPVTDPARDLDATRHLPGFLPWTITEQYSKLKSAFSYLKEYEAAGTPEEIANARENLVYVMGVMGHFVGDAAQPLHTTRHYNGWVGPNPNRFTTNRTFHGWIDYGFLQQSGMRTNELFARIRPAQRPWPQGELGHTNAFPEMLAYVVEQSKLVEPLYRLEKDGKLARGGQDLDAGREFLSAQLVKAGQMLGNLWLAAWQEAPRDSFLQRELAKRKGLSNGRK
ncbi:MAG: hypothetical protein HZA90_22035 [Verrucomicrobia bacterium]|nr:hypothetical protein [Verrucomicrobiota bacterium]